MRFRRARVAVMPTVRSPVVLWREVFSRPETIVFVAAVTLLILIGLLVFASLLFGSAGASQREVFLRQLGALGTGVVLAVLLANLDYRFWKSVHPILFAATTMLLLAVLVFGVPIRGIRAWFMVGGMTLQVSEVAKFSFVVFLAQYASRWTRHVRELRHLLATLLGTVTFSLLIFFQPDFGTAALFVFVWISFLLAMGLGRRELAVMGFATAVVAATLWFGVFRPYQKERILTFLDPIRDPQGSGYNIRQSLTAIGSGGMFGLGFAQGPQSQLRFLPEAQSDFLFAVVGETFGLVGMTMVYVLWVAVLGSLLYLLPRLVEEFAAFFTLALILLLFWEAIIPMAIALSLFPVTGLALPLMSAGGSSLVVHLGMIGVLMNILKNAPLRVREEAVVFG